MILKLIVALESTAHVKLEPVKRQVCRTFAGSEELEGTHREAQAHILTGQAKVNTLAIRVDYHHINTGEEH